MQRNLPELANASYDVLVIGGGIYGACVAWEAASRGLSVALVEKQDFGAATSANSLKIIHGGLRYLQHADFKRMRESIQERKNLLRIAPHLVHPLPILVPIYGHGLKGREAMKIALLVNDLMSCDRNWFISDRSQHIPAGTVLSKTECLGELPSIHLEGLTGGALFTDAQVYNSERLILSFLHSASQAGAQVANYTKVVTLLRNGDRILGARVCDEITGQQLDIQANLVINTTGPWHHEIQSLLGDPRHTNVLVKAINLVVPKFLNQSAVGLKSHDASHDLDAVFDQGGRFLFAAPWRDTAIVGTWYFPFKQSPDQLQSTEAELQICLKDINAAFPFVTLTLEDIQYVHCGLLPSQSTSQYANDIQPAKHYQIIDHRRQGVSGILTISGVKYTTARDVAQKVVNQASSILDCKIAPSKTHRTPIYGGDIDDLKHFVTVAKDQFPERISSTMLSTLIFNYGTAYEAIVKGAMQEKAGTFPEQLLVSQVRYAVREEMAQHLSDVVLRRTELGSAGQPSAAEMQSCAQTMAAELSWDAHRQAVELAHLRSFYAKKVPKLFPKQVKGVSAAINS